MGARNGSPNKQDIDDFSDVHHLIDIYKTLSGLFNVSLRKKQPEQVVMYISCFLYIKIFEEQKKYLVSSVEHSTPKRVH